MVQLPPAFTLPRQLSVTVKSPALPPDAPMLPMLSGDVPVLESTTVCPALVLVTIWVPNDRAAPAGMLAIGARPLPSSATLSVGLTGSLLTIWSVAVLNPAAAGVKVTLMVQEPGFARGNMQL